MSGAVPRYDPRAGLVSRSSEHRRIGCSRSDLARWAEYGYCASHSPVLLGSSAAPSLHPARACPSGWALTGTKADERHALHDTLASTPIPVAVRAGGHQSMIGDKNYFGTAFETELAATGIELLRPVRKGEPPEPANASSNRCDRSPSRSTTPSKANSTSKHTACDFVC